MADPTVLFLAPTVSIWGGVQTWLDQTARSLRAAGWRVVVGLCGGPRFHDARAYAAAHPELAWLEVRCLTGTPEGRAQAVLRVLERAHPDVFAVVNVGDAVEAARRWKGTRVGRGCRVVFTVHGFSPPQLAEIAERSGTIDRVVTTNRLTQRIVVDLCRVDPGRVGYAPYGAEAPLNGFDAGKPDLLRIGWLGRFEETQKRVSDLGQVLLGCAAAGLEFTCDLAGDGPELPALRARLAPLVAAGRVTVRGHVPREELYRSFYPGLDILLLTSSWETGPIVAWEAMRHGAAVVSTQYRGLQEEGALKDRLNCLIAPVGDVSGLVGHIVALGSDHGRRERIAAEGRRLAEVRYSIEASGEAWDRELRIAVDAPPVSPQGVPPGRASGRLDRLVGNYGAELARRVLGRRAKPREEADEWPHAAASLERSTAMRSELAGRGLTFDATGGGS